MPNHNINFVDEIFAINISDAQTIYSIKLEPKFLTEELEAASLGYAMSTMPPTKKIDSWLTKYGVVVLIKDTDTPRITVFVKGLND